MAKEIKRVFRPEHRDIEVLYEDALGVRKFLYVGLPADVNATIAEHFAMDDGICEAVKQAAEAAKT